MPDSKTSEDDPLMGQKQVLRQLSIGRTTFHKYRKTGDFPVAEVRSDAGYDKKWRKSAVNKFIAGRLISRHPPP